MSLTVEQRVKLFVDQVDAAPHYDDYEELLGVFEWREGLADTVPFDGTLSDEFPAEYLSAEQPLPDDAAVAKGTVSGSLRARTRTYCKALRLKLHCGNGPTCRQFTHGRSLVLGLS